MPLRPRLQGGHGRPVGRCAKFDIPPIKYGWRNDSREFFNFAGNGSPEPPSINWRIFFRMSLHGQRGTKQKSVNSSMSKIIEFHFAYNFIQAFNSYIYRCHSRHRLDVIQQNIEAKDTLCTFAYPLYTARQ